MNIIYVKKRAGRLYKSEDVFAEVCRALDLGALALSHDESGAPEVVSADSASLCDPASPESHGAPDAIAISISDTKAYWCCALGRGRIGIDIEEKRKVVPSLVRRLHKYEQEYLSGLEEGSSEWLAEILTIWTRKEAYMKFCGAGLRMGLSSFSVIDKSLDYKTVIDSSKGPDAFVCSLDAPYGLTGALCSEGAFEIQYTELEYNGMAAKPALEKATDLLSERMYSSGELRSKLLKLSYSREEADYAVSELTDRGYLDDAGYAEIYARHAAASGKGNRRIASELRLKGVSGEIISQTVLGHDDNNPNAEGNALYDPDYDEPESERDRAMRVAAKMPCTNEKEKARIARKLAGLGYESSVIYDTIGKLWKKEDL